MTSEWRTVQLSEVASEVTVGFVGTMATEYIDHGIPFLRSLNVDRFKINSSDIRYISRDFHSRISKSRLKPGDVVIVRTGKPGTCAVIPEELLESNCSDLVIVRCGSEIFNRFLCYYVNSAATNHIAAHLVGAVQQHFNVASAKTMEIPLPPIQEQKAIAHILGTLDDKIELNRKTNETLEAMAKALFKSWFVDFDPVRAKAKGRPTGLPADISDLSPYSLEDSELGEIPTGWRVGCLSDCCEITMGQSPPGDTYNEDGDGLPFYQGKTDFGFRFPGRRIYCSSPTRQASIGATLISVRAPVGSANIAREICSIGRGIAALKSRQSADSFVYYLIGTLQNVFESYNSEGTVFGAINGKDLASIQVVSPSIEAITVFNSQCLSMDESIITNTLETDYLTAVRDTLLPKLISGEIRIPDAEKLLEEAGI
jgi:type I restriction enzyme S subunit